MCLRLRMFHNRRYKNKIINLQNQLIKCYYYYMKITKSIGHHWMFLVRKSGPGSQFIRKFSFDLCSIYIFIHLFIYLFIYLVSLLVS